MNFSRIFVDRPVLAGVLSALIVLLGVFASARLPIAEYPEVVPPSIVVRAQLPGASSKEIAETVASPLEEAINGVENMLYMSSLANSDGTLTLTVTFELGADPDKAQQMVQNRVSQALQRLPEEVQRIGVTTVKSSTDVTLLVHLVSPTGRYDMKYLSNYAALNVHDRLARIPGVAAVLTYGASEYAMRIWLDPGKVAARGLTANDVVEAIRAQNVQVAAGAVGAAPTSPGTVLQIPVNAKGRLRTASDFGAIVLRSRVEDGITYLRDVARIELGTSDYALGALLDNQPAVALPIMRAPGSNALRIAAQVRDTMKELSSAFPEGLEYRFAYDPTEFVRASIAAVVKTLLEA
ncbi:MAG TPA: efflux RND transporter permease subunit, partial [Steroidobacteraceae bacterium]